MPDKLFEINRAKDYFPWIAVGIIFLAAIASLNLMGRVWGCDEGDYAPWSWNVWSPHNSQHLIDPYTFTHMLHGILEFFLIGLVFPRLPMVWRFALAIFIESSWEVAENTNAVIQRYREATVSLDYYGDSIINSIGDILSCAAGFLIAHRLKFWRSVVLFLATEIILLFWIRDSLLLNILMLIYPIESIKQWQTGM